MAFSSQVSNESTIKTVKSGPAICFAHEDHVIFEALGGS